MGYFVDNAIAARIIYLFVQPFDKWDAFKHGIINKEGKILRKAHTLTTGAEKDAWTMLHRLVNRLKRMLAVVPTGRSMMTSIAAAYMLIREGVTDDTPDVEMLFADCYNSLNEGADPEFVLDMIRLAEEGEAIANTTDNIPKGPTITVKKNVPKKIRKALPKPNLEEHVTIYIEADGQYML